MLKDLNSLAAKNKIVFSEKQYQLSKEFMTSHLKGLIARNIWKNNEKNGLTNEYYQVINQTDPMVKVGLGKF
jgi:hypothetical protein